MGCAMLYVGLYVRISPPVSLLYQSILKYHSVLKYGQGSRSSSSPSWLFRPRLYLPLRRLFPMGLGPRLLDLRLRDPHRKTKKHECSTGRRDTMAFQSGNRQSSA